LYVAAGSSIDPATSIGAVALTVADLDRARQFYERAIGLRTLADADGEVRLGVDAESSLIELFARPDAPPRPRGTTGLFHLAILVPTRAELAVALRRVAGAGWRLSGASDHLVSEALYLQDPEGNGIEIYRDRPRDQWRVANGEVEMATLPLDLDSLVREATGSDAEPERMSDATRIGHVHLQVADLAEAERFYADTLGFEVTVRGYPGALFMSAGGYHHHVAVNTWAGDGAAPPEPGSRGLRWFEIALPTRQELERVERRLAAAGVEAAREGEALEVADPSANPVRLLVAG
jgi:catechol 2,3-dioxygenase